MTHTVELALDLPPQVENSGVGVHGHAGPHDVFRLPRLWQLHLYGYSGTLEFGGFRHPIRPGHVSLVPPGAEVHFHYDTSPSQHLYAHFRLPGEGERHRVPVMQDAGPDAAMLTTLLRQTVAAGPQSPARAAAELWTVLWRTTGLAGASGNHEGSRHPALRTAMVHIEQRLADPLNVPDIARAAGISHTHLTRLFREDTGLTVVGYIRRRRVERARHLLIASTLAIPAIAATVGIPDLQAFNKTCRKELGASPRAVRRTGAPRPAQPRH
ncbi:MULTISPECIES: AraC family transcriptional regulator [unclassified Streptomyces]|uniref:AraC family transcriptional regulator n=1 Tax=unclassified Streptomyces TaxID=2593676 RepID=UPI00225024A5|nr:MULTISPECIES: AraC family transcriptional regulator [unclassified Streptomyces]MCX5058862.1 AraC family transcriptional regulator [Streptomyces sp. NBC_00452]MCX5290010.1 AraC family transcriptional regulator [Streptomyces sp. NBC_00183]